MSNNNTNQIEPISKQDLQAITTDALRKLHNGHFPFWVFPDQVRNIVLETTKCLNFPIDFISAALFFVSGLATGNTTRVKVMESWEEGSVLYLCLVGRAGTNKSHPLSWALKPILDRDGANFTKYERELEDFARSGDPDQKGAKPRWTKTLVSDFTQEALASIHKFNKRGLGVYVDELAGWIRNFNRYNAGSEEQFWLSAWSGKPIIVDRRSSESISIDKSFIAVVGTIQNALVNEITSGSKNKNGFTDRILFVIPDDLRKTKWSEDTLAASVTSDWFNMIKNILDYELEFDENRAIKSKVMRYDDEALRDLKRWQELNTNRYNSQINSELDGILSKHDIYINRFALILQIMNDACLAKRSETIGVQAVKGAIEISEYFIQQSIKINKQTARERFFAKADINKKNFYNDLPDQFTTAQAVALGETGSAKFNEKAVRRFIGDAALFERVSHGNYRKITL